MPNGARNVAHSVHHSHPTAQTSGSHHPARDAGRGRTDALMREISCWLPTEGTLGA